MKITKKHNDGLTSFFAVDTGDTFLFDNEVYLKLDRIDPEGEDSINAICLNDGDVSWFNNDIRVKIVQAELIVEV
jgi:hypothetical protein